MQPLGRKIQSAYAFRPGKYSNFKCLYRSSVAPGNSPNVWIDFWLEEIVVNNLTVELSDSLSSGSGTSSYTFV